MSDQRRPPSRRTFLSTSLKGSALLAAGAVAGAHGSVADEDNPVSVAPPATAESTPVLARLWDAIQRMPAFNNHFHPDGVRESLDWYHPHQIVGKTVAASKGLTAALPALLDLPDKDITEQDSAEIVRRYEALAEGQPIGAYYDKLCHTAGVSHTVLMAMPYEVELTRDLPSRTRKLGVYVEQLMFPLDNTRLKAVHPAHANRLNGCEESLRVHAERHGPRPGDFAGYLQYVEHIIKDVADSPAAACVKLGFSYWRTLDIRPVERSAAQRVYETPTSSTEDYRQLQDYLAYHILRVCGQHNLPVQIHTGLGADDGLALADSNAALLDHLLSRPELKTTRVICLHGSYPFCRETGVIARRANVYLDFSWMPLLLHPRTLAGYLREWLEVPGPWKLLFGVDAAGLALIPGTWCARRALALALAGMIRDEQITETDALSYARGVLSANALSLYGGRIAG